VYHRETICSCCLEGKRVVVAQAHPTPLSWITSRLPRRRADSQEKNQHAIAALDGVRAIAALLVVSLHISEIAGVPWDVNQNPVATAFAFFGRTGVVLFFVLSGFLLFLPYARALLFQEAWPSARAFYLRRIFRIWPGYYLTLIAMILLFSHAYLQPGRWPDLALFLTFFMDSSQRTWQQIDGPFWTLATEWQFYLLLPLIALAFSLVVKRLASSPRKRLYVVLLCCTGVIAWGLFTRGLGLVYQRHPQINLLLPHAVLNVVLFFAFGIQGKYLEVFALGMGVSALYTFARHPETGRSLHAVLQRLSNLAWVAGLLILTFIALWQVEAETDRNAMPDFTALGFLHPLRSFYAWLGEPLAGVGFALCILAILSGSRALKGLFELPLLRWIGMLSYGLYMWHLNLLLAFHSWIAPHLSGPGATLSRDLVLWGFVCLVIIPFCALFYRTIEAPGIRLGARLLRNMRHQQRPRSQSPQQPPTLPELSLPVRSRE
jgi:peptidoglycan/LPS O-acetylase OafA/YrhL